MMTVILGFLAIVFFVVGVSLLWNGYRSVPSPEKIVPRQDLNTAEENFKAAKAETEKLRQQLTALTVEFDQTRTKLAEAEKNVQALKESRAQILKSQSRIEGLERDLNFLMQKADTQAVEAVDLITRLGAENENLQKAVKDALAAANPQEIERLTEENQKLKIQLEGFAGKVGELEAQAADQAGMNGKLQEAQAEKTGLSDENAALKAQLVEVGEKIRGAQADHEKVQAGYAAQLEQLQAAINRLQAENAALKEKAVAVAAAPPETWQNEKDELEKELQGLRKSHTVLLEKEKILQFKLVQSRARATGLEKICEGFKYQVEHQKG